MKINETSTITLDDQAYEVSKLSEEVQQMVAYMDDWRQQEVDLASKLLMVRGALRDIQNVLSTTIQKEIKETRERAEGLGLVDPDAGSKAKTVKPKKSSAGDKAA